MEYGVLALWLVFCAAFWLASAPIAALVFDRFPDRGFSLALPLGFSILWLGGYWTGQVRFGTIPALLALGVLVAGTVLAWRRLEEPVDYRAGVAPIAVFVVAFGLLLWFRALDPAVHPIGGEKFLDFGLLKSLLRAEALPPEDMWFAGEPVAYYYGGHVLAALLSLLTDTPARYAYNLTLVTVYATLVTAAYGVAGAIAADRDLNHRRAGVLGAVFVGIASNLQSPLRLVRWLAPDAADPAFASIVGAPTGLSKGPDAFSYWDASRVIDGTINEFPFFAFVNGDLHAHMVSTPFLLLSVAFLFSYARTPPANRRRRLALLCGAIPPLAGMLAVVNTWSFPTVAGLTGLTVALAPADPVTLIGRGSGGGRRAEIERPLAGLVTAAVVAGLGALWTLPFLLGPASGRSVALLPDRSALGPLLVVHGAFLGLFAAYAARGRSDRRLALGGVGSVLLLALALDRTVTAGGVAIFATLVAVGWWLLREADAWVDGVGYETVLLVAGAGLALVVEMAFVEEQAGPGRMNTVFKTYMQVWVLWGVAAGAIATRLLEPPRQAGTTIARAARSRRVRAVAIAVLVASLSVYAALAVSAHADRHGGGEATLDATAFVEDQHPREAAAIAWLDSRPGRPHIVTAAPGGYRWDPASGKGASAPSSLTGIPTVAGWHHERGYRGAAAFRARVDDVEAIYEGSPDRQAALLREYDVHYVYLGPAERARYDVTIRDLPGLSVAHSSGGQDGVVVFAVDHDQLPA